MFSKDHYLNLFASCPIVQGYSRSIIVDLQRNNYWFITNEQAQVFKEQNSVNIAKIYTQLQADTEEVIENFIHFLIDNEIAYLSNDDESDLFPNINFKWKSTSVINTLSVDVESCEPIITKEHIKQLRTKNLILICKKKIDLNALLETYQKTPLRSIEIIINSKDYLKNSLIQIASQHPKITAFHLRKSKETKTIIYNHIPFFYTQKSDYRMHTFRIDIRLFSEAIHFHPYFNQRMHINTKGQIKNSAETKKTFGNINDDNLVDIVESPAFRRLWNVKKEDIDICHDCEFRFMCVDKRIPHKRADKKWYSNEECTYNPYICKEVKQDGYRSLEDTGVYTSSKGFKIMVDQFIESKELE